MAKKRTISIGDEQISLTDKEILFADHYLCTHNATDAAIKAGYSEKCAGQQGHENLKKPEITKYLQFKAKPVMEQLNITQERVLKEYATIAFSNPTDFLNIDFSLKQLDSLDPDKVGAIKHIEKTDKGHKITLHDKIPALQKLWELVNPSLTGNDPHSDFFKGITDYYSKN